MPLNNYRSVVRVKWLGSIFFMLVVAALMAPAGPAWAASVKDDAESCLKTAKGPLTPSNPNQQAAGAIPAAPAQPILARVGKAAPDFEANAFHQKGFKTVKLSDYKGKWVVLCFYPGDFTFV